MSWTYRGGGQERHWYLRSVAGNRVSSRTPRDVLKSLETEMGGRGRDPEDLRESDKCL